MTDDDRHQDTASLRPALCEYADAFAADRAAGGAAGVPPAAALADARERAADLGVPAVSDAVGAALSMLARVVGAHTVVEVGTGAGVSAQWLLHGMRDDGVLTTIDIEPEHQRTARAAFAAAGIAPSRTRLIGGRGLDVLPRLADASYEMVFVDCGGSDHAPYVAEAVRLLRPGGMLAVHGLPAAGTPWDQSRRDAAALDARETLRLLAEHDALLPSLLPLGGGLICAARA